MERGRRASFHAVHADKEDSTFSEFGSRQSCLYRLGGPDSRAMTESF